MWDRQPSSSTTFSLSPCRTRRLTRLWYGLMEALAAPHSSDCSKKMGPLWLMMGKPLLNPIPSHGTERLTYFTSSHLQVSGSLTPLVNQILTSFTQICLSRKILLQDYKTSTKLSPPINPTICGFQVSPMLASTARTSHGRSTSGTCSRRCTTTQTRWSRWRASWLATDWPISIRTQMCGTRTLSSTWTWSHRVFCKRLKRRTASGSGINSMMILIHTQMHLSVTTTWRQWINSCPASINMICTGLTMISVVHLALRKHMVQVLLMVKISLIREDRLSASVPLG